MPGLKKSIPYVFRLLEAMNIPVITMDGYEADDIIDSIVYEAKAQGYVTYMMTPDERFC